MLFSHWYSHEAVPDVMALLNSLVDVNGQILVPGLNDDVTQVTDEEKKLYDDIDFDPVSVKWTRQQIAKFEEHSLGRWQ